MDKLTRRIQTLESQVAALQQQIQSTERTTYIGQEHLRPGVLKNRHFGEGNSYVVAGLDADLPTGAVVTSSVTAYFATDTNKWYIYNGAEWVFITLAP